MSRPSHRTAAALLCAALVLTSGCIRRYAAPDDPAPADQPYSAAAAMQRVVPPPGDGGALPAAAFRLVLGPEPGRWFADSALLGLDAATVLDGFDGDLKPALALFAAGDQPVVVLVHGDRLPQQLWCDTVESLGGRAVLALGRSGYGDDPADKRPAQDGMSRDPLGAGPVDRLCPAEPTPVQGG